MGITLMPYLGWHSQAATSSLGLPFPKACFGVVQGDLFGGDLLPREPYMSNTCWFPAEEGLGAFLALGLVTGASMAPGIGCLPWVSAVLSCSCCGVSLLMKRLKSRCWSFGLQLIRAITVGNQKEPYFHWKHVALGRHASWHLTLTH